jgi:anaerobic magnesium-protoporphyrin IX monomethyl ester cyclase
MKRPKVVLYNPKSVFFDMPLALLAVGSALPSDRFRVIIIDGRVEADAERKVLEACESALCFGVTALTGAPLRDAVVISRIVKEKYPRLPVVWGGWHPSLFPVEALRDEPAIDITVFGQGEATFRELVEHLRQGADLSEVRGLAYRTKDGEITKTLGRPLQNMNQFPRVNYDLIEVERYFKLKKRRQFDYISSTGCRFRCAFCADPFVYKRGWTALDPERMGEELEHWKKKHNFSDVNFQDETFFTQRRRVNQIAGQFVERRLRSTWAGTMRADQGFRMSEEEFDGCKRSGLRRVLVGVESGSQEMMDWMMKDIKLEQVYETARRCAERDIAVIFPFIVGFPGESDESVRDTLRVAMELNAMHPSFTTPIFYFKPYPGSKITQDVVDRGYALPETLDAWADFDYIGSSGPWVSRQKYLRIERFKFYNKLAWQSKRWITWPLKGLARLRCKTQYFRFPVEKIVAEWIAPPQSLS